MCESLSIKSAPVSNVRQALSVDDMPKAVKNLETGLRRAREPKLGADVPVDLAIRSIAASANRDPLGITPSNVKEVLDEVLAEGETIVNQAGEKAGDQLVQLAAAGPIVSKILHDTPDVPADVISDVDAGLKAVGHMGAETRRTLNLLQAVGTQLISILIAVGATKGFATEPYGFLMLLSLLRTLEAIAAGKAGPVRPTFELHDGFGVGARALLRLVKPTQIDDGYVIHLVPGHVLLMRAYCDGQWRQLITNGAGVWTLPEQFNLEERKAFSDMFRESTFDQHLRPSDDIPVIFEIDGDTRESSFDIIGDGTDEAPLEVVRRT